MNRLIWYRLPVIAILLLSGCAFASAQAVPASSFSSGLTWRNIGPFRGGRVSAVTGVVGQPGIFYMGLPMGGVWKTTSAGTTWFPIFDSVKDASSVGGIEVAPSDPNVIYVGMGDMLAGGGISRGNGVYKSTDAGKTWKHLGLDKTDHIPSILVDPHNPDLVMVAAQGDNHTKSEDRGLYRSIDGGLTWKKTLYVDDETGAQKIAWAYDHPNVMLATTDHFYNPPGQFGRGGFGPGRPSGPNAKLFKSTDEGLTWKEIKGSGLPTLTGRTCVAIAMNTDSQRMFMVGNFGLYRSDDGGAHWRQMDAADRRVANGQGGYNCGVYVNSQNPDIVYVINTCCYRSVDGGKTFTGFKGAPGGDDPQQAWIDPTDGKRLFFGTDQGATVSLDGGMNWTSWYNQSTAQVYHISVDNQFPYWVYATQQDSGSIATSSRGNLGEITPMDWLPHPGYEFGSIVADPLNAKVSYAGGPSGGIIKTTYPSGQWIDVSPNMNSKLGLRKVGNQPLIFSPVNSHELLTGFQCVMATTDGGRSWHTLSPDLTLKPGAQPEPAPAAPAATKPDAAKPAVGKPGSGKPQDNKPAVSKPATGQVRPEDEDQQAAGKPDPDKQAVSKPAAGQVRPEDADQPEDDGDGDEDVDPDELIQRGVPGGAIESISVSSVDGNILWAGTSNGLIKLSKDHGENWDDVSILTLPDGARSDISAIDASHQDAGTAYVAVDCHNAGDYKPYFYRTTDYGATWTLIVNGLPDSEPSGSFARVIRADTRRRGLVFAGTESSVYVSFDDGDHWQSLALNLPNTSYRDMVVKGNDLVVGTYGRGFSILDDLSPLRQITPSSQSEAAYLYKPSDAIRVRRNVNGDTPFPPEIPHAENPPDGAILYYYLGSHPSGDLTLDVHDSRGNLVRHMSSALVPALSEPPPPVPDFWVEKPESLPTAAGLNRTSWNLRYDSPNAFNHSYEINANPGHTPPSPEGPLVLPGVYHVTLTVDGKSYQQSITVKNDPRSPASSGELREQYALQMKLYHCAQESWACYKEVGAVRSEVGAILDSEPAPDLEAAATALDEKLAAVGGSAGFGRGFGGFPGAGGPPPKPSFARINSSADREINTLDSGDMAPNEFLRKACESVCSDMEQAVKSWEALKSKDLPAFNAVLAKNRLKPISAGGTAAPPQAARKF